MVEIQEYIKQFSTNQQLRMNWIIDQIKSYEIDLESKISYGMPAFFFNKKPLIYFAAYSKHLGIYALPATHLNYKTQLINYKQGKGSLQVPWDKDFPMDIISQMIQFRIHSIECELKQIPHRVNKNINKT